MRCFENRERFKKLKGVKLWVREDLGSRPWAQEIDSPAVLGIYARCMYRGIQLKRRMYSNFAKAFIFACVAT